METKEILNHLHKMFPQAHCELDHQDPFQLLCAVILSAQTTDVSVNKVTPTLFAHFPTPEALAKAPMKQVEKDIHSIGLYRNKAKNLIAMAKQLIEEYDGVVPNDFEALQTLPGVGRKTANVIMAEAFHVPALAVDTHVERVSKRLGLVPSTKSVEDVERILKKKIDQNQWILSHHLFIFFGRYKCKSQHPQCEDCPFESFCRYQKGSAR